MGDFLISFGLVIFYSGLVVKYENPYWQMLAVFFLVLSFSELIDAISKLKGL